VIRSFVVLLALGIVLLLLLVPWGVKPLAVLLTLVLVGVLLLCMIPVLWWLVQSIENRERKSAVFLGIVALGIFMFSAWAGYWMAPKGGRTIAELELPDGRAFVVRHYRYGWLDYPKVRFYARDTNGSWTSFALIAELVNSNGASLALDESAQNVDLGTGGWYRIQEKDFVNIDGSRPASRRLPPGIEPGEEDIHARPDTPPQ
jgi:hypothetical protein